MKNHKMSCKYCHNNTVTTYEMIKVDGKKYTLFVCPVCDNEELMEVWRVIK